MSLSHWTIKPVTTEPVGTLPVMVIVVSVTEDSCRDGAGNGTEHQLYEHFHLKSLMWLL
ncbi:hypothetical protein GBAR_LOCUS29997 [Geodia barretti]|uniref:Uncharacterized protein n=1 Tax=Geodia barretti TaxID=519541 RepID=A0AA35TVI5_GEOBA|nr:hypothetical protein GBAR_LOCUS29997 [Geodia barretti]